MNARLAPSTAVITNFSGAMPSPGAIAPTIGTAVAASAVFDAISLAKIITAATIAMTSGSGIPPIPETL